MKIVHHSVLLVLTSYQHHVFHVRIPYICNISEYQIVNAFKIVQLDTLRTPIIKSVVNVIISVQHVHQALLATHVHLITHSSTEGFASPPVQ